jgi:hypothetical protein
MPFHVLESIGLAVASERLRTPAVAGHLVTNGDATAMIRSYFARRLIALGLSRGPSRWQAGGDGRYHPLPVGDKDPAGECCSNLGGG